MLLAGGGKSGLGSPEQGRGKYKTWHNLVYKTLVQE